MEEFRTKSEAEAAWRKLQLEANARAQRAVEQAKIRYEQEKKQQSSQLS